MRLEQRENKNARKGIKTDILIRCLLGLCFARENKNARKGIKTVLAAFELRETQLTRENKNARKGIKTFPQFAVNEFACIFERKQKRPQGH